MRVLQLDGLVVGLVASLATSVLLSTSTTVAAASFPSTPFYQQNPDRNDLQRSDGSGAGPSSWVQDRYSQLAGSSAGFFGGIAHDGDEDDDDVDDDNYDDDDDNDEHDDAGSYLEGGVHSSMKHKKRKGWVYLIRHGEKVKSSDKTGLSDRGVQRAKCLINVFGRRSSSSSNNIDDTHDARRTEVRYPTDYILAQDFKPSGQRRRPYETVKPLAKYHGIKLDHSCDRDDEQCASHKIKKRTRAGKNVLVVWEHARLSEIARELGVKGLAYPSERYDIVFKIRGKKVHSIVSEKCQGLDEEWMHWKSERKGKHGRSPHGGRLIDDESWADEPIEDDSRSKKKML